MARTTLILEIDLSGPVPDTGQARYICAGLEEAIPLVWHDYMLNEAVAPQLPTRVSAEWQDNPAASAKAKPTKRQMAILRSVPDQFERFKPQRGIPYLVANPTISALVKKGLIEIDTAPPRWRKTDAGRAAAFQL